MYEHLGLSNLRIRYRYWPKHPCPDRNCVRWKFVVSPCLLAHQGRTSGISHLVQLPDSSVDHLSCYASMVLVLGSLPAVGAAEARLRSNAASPLPEVSWRRRCDHVCGHVRYPSPPQFDFCNFFSSNI